MFKESSAKQLNQYNVAGLHMSKPGQSFFAVFIGALVSFSGNHKMLGSRDPGSRGRFLKLRKV